MSSAPGRRATAAGWPSTVASAATGTGTSPAVGARVTARRSAASRGWPGCTALATASTASPLASRSDATPKASPQPTTRKTPATTHGTWRRLFRAERAGAAWGWRAPLSGPLPLAGLVVSVVVATGSSSAYWLGVLFRAWDSATCTER